MKKTTLLEFINKHTGNIDKARWVSDNSAKTLKSNVASDNRSLLVDITLNNWDGFGNAEVGIGNMQKFKTELSGLYDDEVTCTLNYNDDNSRITSIDVIDSKSVATIATSDLDMIGQSSKLKYSPPVSTEIIFDEELKGRFLKAKSALPDVETFTVMMNKKGELEFIIGFSKINSSRYSLKVKTNPGMDKVDEPLHFNANFLKDILLANKECNTEASILSVSNDGLCSISFKQGDFECKYYLTSTDQD